MRIRIKSRWSYTLAPLVMVLAVGCSRDTIEVDTEQGEHAYGRTDLLTLFDQFSRSERSPAQFREIAVAVSDLSARFDEDVAAEAERNLVLLALAPLEAHRDQPWSAQMQALATTVWPTALRVEPELEEDAAAYVERLCAGSFALECKGLVPEYRPIVLGALVWSRLAERARAALLGCESCRGSAGFDEALARYERHARDAGAQAKIARGLARPERWPRAGKHAAPWSGAPVVALENDGQLVFEGDSATSDRWSALIAAARRDLPVLAVHMQPSARVQDLRAILREAAAAGVAEVALQVRMQEYPYTLGEYRIAARRKAEPSMQVRDTDTIQALVPFLDTVALTGALPAGL